MILRSPYFSTPVTESWTDYFYYRGKMKASVLTLRFNNTPEFSADMVEHRLLERLYFYFGSMSTVDVIVDYDVLLRDGRDSFYIWRSNSNRHHVDQSDEFQLTILPPQIHELTNRLCIDPTRILDNKFLSSSVSVDRMLAVVCSFMVLRP